MITKEEIARAYALMECERAPAGDRGYGYYPAKVVADRFLSLGLITITEWIKFISNEFEHGEKGPFKEAFRDLFAKWEHENPLPAGWRYGIEMERCFPVAQEPQRKSYDNV